MSAGLYTIRATVTLDGATIGTGSSYALTQAEVGKTITVTASYTDLQGTAESVSSAATSAVLNVNDAPTGCGERGVYGSGAGRAGAGARSMMAATVS